MSRRLSPRACYDRLVRDGRIRADPHQQQVVDALQLRHRYLCRQARMPALQTLWRRLSGGLVAAEPPAGLYLWGGVGRGKTWLMDLLYDALPPGAARRLHYHHFMQQINHRLHALGRGRDPLPQVADGILAGARALCLDEFFVNDIGNAMLLGGILKHLFRSGVMLVTTSNIPPDELYAGGLQRARFLPTIELLQSRCEVLRLDGATDYRLRQLQQMRLYLHPCDNHAMERLREMFTGMAAGPVQDDVCLTINRRPLRVLCCAHSQVWMHFDELCRKPRANSDYQELAAEFGAVFVSGVPAMHDNDNDAARRFIDLVDAFYDQRVKLVIAAAAAPEALYQGRRLAFEFQRTRSRLAAMQTRDYLARAHRPA